MLVATLECPTIKSSLSSRPWGLQRISLSSPRQIHLPQLTALTPVFNQLTYIVLALRSIVFQSFFLPREAMGDSNDRGWFHWINHGHVTYFSL